MHAHGAEAVFVQNLATKVNLTLHTRAGFSVQQASVVSRLFGEAEQFDEHQVAQDRSGAVREELVLQTYKCVYEVAGEVVVVGVCRKDAAVHPTHRLVRHCVSIVKLIAGGGDLAKKDRYRAKDVTAAKLQKHSGELYLSFEEALHQTGGVAFAEEVVEVVATRPLLSVSGMYAAPPSRRRNELSRAAERVDEEIATRLKLQQIVGVPTRAAAPAPADGSAALAEDLQYIDPMDVSVDALLPPAAPTALIAAVKGGYGSGELPRAASRPPATPPQESPLSDAVSPTGGAFAFMNSPAPPAQKSAAQPPAAAKPKPPTTPVRETSLGASLDDLFSAAAAPVVTPPQDAALPPRAVSEPAVHPPSATAAAGPATAAATHSPVQDALSLSQGTPASAAPLEAKASTLSGIDLDSLFGGGGGGSFAAAPRPPAAPQAPPPAGDASHTLSAMVSESVSATFNAQGEGGEWSLMGEMLLLGKGALLPVGDPGSGDETTAHTIYVRVRGAATPDDIRPNPTYATLHDAAKCVYKVTVRQTVAPRRAAPLAVLKYRQLASTAAYAAVYPVKAKATWAAMPRPGDTPPAMIDQVTLQWAANPYVKLTSVAFDVNGTSDAFAPDKQQSKPKAQFDAASGALRWVCMAGGKAVDGAGSTLQARLHSVATGAARDDVHAATRRPTAVQFEGTGVVGAMKIAFFADEACATPAVLTGGVNQKFKSGKYVVRSG